MANNLPEFKTLLEMDRYNVDYELKIRVNGDVSVSMVRETRTSHIDVLERELIVAAYNLLEQNDELPDDN